MSRLTTHNFIPIGHFVSDDNGNTTAKMKAERRARELSTEGGTNPRKWVAVKSDKHHEDGSYAIVRKV